MNRRRSPPPYVPSLAELGYSTNLWVTTADMSVTPMLPNLVQPAGSNLYNSPYPSSLPSPPAHSYMTPVTSTLATSRPYMQDQLSTTNSRNAPNLPELLSGTNAQIAINLPELLSNIHVSQLVSTTSSPSPVPTRKIQVTSTSHPFDDSTQSTSLIRKARLPTASAVSQYEIQLHTNNNTQISSTTCTGNNIQQINVSAVTSNTSSAQLLASTHLCTIPVGTKPVLHSKHRIATPMPQRRTISHTSASMISPGSKSLPSAPVGKRLPPLAPRPASTHIDSGMRSPDSSMSPKTPPIRMGLAPVTVITPRITPGQIDSGTRAFAGVAPKSVASKHIASKRPSSEIATDQKKQVDPNSSIPMPGELDIEDIEDGDKKRKKARTTFTGKQIFELEKHFETKKYLSGNERMDLARKLSVTETQVSKFIYLNVLFYMYTIQTNGYK